MMNAFKNHKKLFSGLNTLLFILLLSLIAQSATAARHSYRSTYTETKFPIVLAHGFLGFESMLGIINYWPGIPRDLQRGGASVYVTEVSTVNSSEARGEQLLRQIENVIAISGKPKVNIIGHSQGALDARYVASVRPDLVASVTAIGGPTLPNSLGGLYGALDNPVAWKGIGALGRLIAFLSGNKNPVEVSNAAVAFSVDTLTTFNNHHGAGVPEVYCGEGAPTVNINGYTVHYYSWGGTALVTNFFDPTDLLVLVTGLFIDEKNDGFVTQCGSHLGDVIRDDYRQNHLDLGNLMFGLVTFRGTKPKAVFRAHANRLKNAGL